MRAALRLIALAVLAVPALAQAQPDARPPMTEAEGLQLFEAGGFRVSQGQAINMCGQPARPVFSYVDLNGDGAPEAVATDRNPACYGAGGELVSVLARGADGRWRPVARAVGRLKFEPSRTRGWQDARITTDCERIWTYDGRAYVKGGACVEAGPAGPTMMVGATGAAAAKAPVLAAEHPAILAAAGFRQRDGRWVGEMDGCEATLDPAEIRDLNADGVPEAVVVENGTACYGMTGQGIYLLTRQAPGRWTLVFDSPGVPVFRAERTDGWPDLVMGGPGFCQPLYRWTGKTYAFSRNEEEEKGACAGR